ncbi:MAG: ABC transporter substrate-binding protein [Rubrivivax sp.]|nr:ABC transporter substrate-binding protein [Rubrivivax sp.]
MRRTAGTPSRPAPSSACSSACSSARSSARSSALPVALLWALGTAFAQPIHLRDDRGTEHRLPAPPQRIVTLLPSLTETAWVLGIGARLVGVDRYSNWPPQISALPRLGGLDDAQIEAIARLKPDLVLASTSARALDRLEALGFTVVRLRSESHADVQRTLGLVAQLLGTPDEAERVWARLQAELAAAAARVPAALRGRSVYFEIGGGPYAAGTTSFIGETLARLGLVNIVPRELGPFPKLNPEFIVRARPEVIMGVQREQAALRSRPGWQVLPAVQHGRLCGFDESLYEVLTRPSPRLGESAGVLADCLVRIAKAVP